jgi:hypothetical protein
VTGLAIRNHSDLSLDATRVRKREIQKTEGQRDSSKAEQGGQLDPQPLAVQSVGVLIGSPSLIAGELL